VAEWSNAPVLKTGDVQASVGSNPTPSAKSDHDCLLTVSIELDPPGSICRKVIACPDEIGLPVSRSRDSKKWPENRIAISDRRGNTKTGLESTMTRFLLTLLAVVGIVLPSAAMAQRYNGHGHHGGQHVVTSHGGHHYRRGSNNWDRHSHRRSRERYENAHRYHGRHGRRHGWH
jgi:hypothetical protein